MICYKMLFGIPTVKFDVNALQEVRPQVKIFHFEKMFAIKRFSIVFFVETLIMLSNVNFFIFSK